MKQWNGASSAADWQAIKTVALTGRLSVIYGLWLSACWAVETIFTQSPFAEWASGYFKTVLN